MEIYELKECNIKEIMDIGKKAWWLARVNLMGSKIPDGIVLPAISFTKFIDSHTDKKMFNDNIAELKKNSILARKNLSVIRFSIRNSHLDVKFISKIVYELKKLNISLSEGVAVRSSSVNEDSSSRVFAGIYSSIINVKNEKELEKAILEVWASRFSETAFIYGGDETWNGGMAVIVQKMIYGIYHGVTFTKAPNTNGDMLIEMAKTTTDIVDGRAPVSSLYVNRKTFTYNNTSDVDDKYINMISKASLYLEEKFNMFCDIEWAVDDNDIFILQCRPISGAFDGEFDYKILNQDKIDECMNAYLGSCQNMYTRFLGKQYMFRKKVLDSGYSAYKQHYVIVRKGCISSELIEKINKIFDTSMFVILEFDNLSNYLLCKKEEIRKHLEAFEHSISSEYLYVRIGEIIKADISGYASLNNEGEVFVEYVTGRMQGLMDGMCGPAQAILKNSEADYISRPIIEKIATIDDLTGKKILVEHNKEIVLLNKSEVEKLIDFTKKLSGFFNNARLEWYICNEKLYGKDISIETNDLICNTNCKNIVSKGTASGKALFIDDLNMLDDIADKYNISLYEHSEEEVKIYNDGNLVKLMDRINNLGKPIIFADRPSVGLIPVAHLASGFVFRQGAILCHLGIFLREKQIPALIDNEAFDWVKKNLMIEICCDENMCTVNMREDACE